MEVESQYGDEVRFIGMPGLADPSEMLEFISATGTDGFDHVPDADGSLWRQFGVTAHRSYVLVNDDGTVDISGYGSLEDDVIDLIAR